MLTAPVPGRFENVRKSQTPAVGIIEKLTVTVVCVRFDGIQDEFIGYA